MGAVPADALVDQRPRALGVDGLAGRPGEGEQAACEPAVVLERRGSGAAHLVERGAAQRPVVVDVALEHRVG
ncbi:hypothetical protein DBR36_14865, partial [Microbacterium sp. HMWF026]